MFTTKKFRTDIVFIVFIGAVVVCILAISWWAKVYQIRLSTLETPYSIQNTTPNRLILSFSNPIKDKKMLEDKIVLSPNGHELQKYFVGDRLILESSTPFPMDTEYTVSLPERAVDGVQGINARFRTPAYVYAALMGSGSLLIHDAQTHTIPVQGAIESFQKVVGGTNLLVHSSDSKNSSDVLTYVNTATKEQKPVVALPNERILGYSSHVNGQWMVQVQRKNIVDGLIAVGLFLGSMHNGHAPDSFWFQAVFGSSFSFTPEGSGIIGKGETSILFVPLEDKPTEVLYIGKSDEVFDISDDGEYILTGMYSGEGMRLELFSADGPRRELTSESYIIQDAALVPGGKKILFLGNTDLTASPQDPTYLYGIDLDTRQVAQLTSDLLWKEVAMDISADGKRVILERQRPVQNAESELWMYDIEKSELTSLNQRGSSPLMLP